MSLTRLWLVLAIALPALAAVIAPVSTVDLAYQLRAGDEILATQALPTVDTWTYTASGLPWVDQQWGAQVVLAAVHDLTGWTGLVLLRAALTAGIVGALLAIARRRGLDARTAALLVIGAFVIAAPAMGLRPQLFGMACLALVLVLVANRRAQPRGLWLVPLVTIVWANLHGSFVLAPAVLGLAWLEDVHDRVPARHRTLAVALVSALAACLTPLGPAAWAYAITLSADPDVTRISEWQPTSIRTVAGLVRPARPVRGARHRVVAAGRSPGAGRDAHPRRGGPGADGARRHSSNQRRRRRRVGPRRGRDAAGLASGRPDHRRPRGPAHRRPVRPHRGRPRGDGRR
jgi:hypothetical protein